MEFSEKQQLIHSHPKPLGWYVWSSFICVLVFWLENQLFCLPGSVHRWRPVAILLRNGAKVALMRTSCGGGSGSASRPTPRQGLTAMRGIGPGGSCAWPVPWVSSSWLERWLVGTKKKAVILQLFTERGKKTCLLASRLACRWIRRSQSGHHDGCSASAGWLWQHRHQPFLPVAGLPASHRRHDLRVASSRWGELIWNGASLEGMTVSSEGSDVKANLDYIIMKQHSSCSAVSWCVPQRPWVCCCRWCPSGLWQQR